MLISTDLKHLNLSWLKKSLISFAWSIKACYETGPKIPSKC